MIYQSINSNIQKQGLELLEACTCAFAELKKAFLDMPSVQQKNFVAILSQTGIQLKPGVYDRISAFWLMRQAQHGWLLAKKREEDPEVQDFIKLLDVVGGDSPLDGMTKTLLSNLFQVLDASEQTMLIAVLENPMNLKSFLKQFEKTPHDQDLLKNFRALLYDVHNHVQIQSNLRLKQLQQQNVPPISKVIVGKQQNKMRHVLQKMTQVRSEKNRT